MTSENQRTLISHFIHKHEQLGEDGLPHHTIYIYWEGEVVQWLPTGEVRLYIANAIPCVSHTTHHIATPIGHN